MRASIRDALSLGDIDRITQRPFTHPLRWALLPGLCCQAAGGERRSADDIATAWYLLYVAAYVLDSVEDGDEPEPWWSELGSGAAINVGTTLIFLAMRSLEKLHRNQSAQHAAPQVIEEFHRQLVIMSDGQHQDLTVPWPAPADWLDIAAAKSGSFFAIACRTGARLAVDDPDRLDAFGRFGHALGIVLQILDDIKDLRSVASGKSGAEGAGLARSLPLAYALEVAPPEICGQLRNPLEAGDQTATSNELLSDLIERTGATLYVATELEKYRRRALEALASASPAAAAGQAMEYLLEDLLDI